MYELKDPRRRWDSTVTENDLDELLSTARPQVSVASAAIARLMTKEVFESHAKSASSPERRWRRARILALVGAGAVALSAATTYGAYQLSIPPFVQTEPGVERVTEPISLDYTTDRGTVLDCKLYIEFTDVTGAQRAALNALGHDPKWRGFGQRTYDSLPATNRATQNGPESLWNDRVNEAVYAEAMASIPGLQFHAGPGTPSIHGSTIRCEYPEGQR